MRRLQLSESVVRSMTNHGRSSYPDECCGFLIADASTDPTGMRDVVDLEPAQNTETRDAHRHYRIETESLRALERRLAGSGRELVGVYHSHPDRPATPYEIDTEEAWPWYTYLIVGVAGGVPGPILAYELELEPRRFVPIAWVAAGKVIPEGAMAHRQGSPRGAVEP